MSMGIGKTYFVMLLEAHYGTLEEMCKYMEEHAPQGKTWYELKPILSIKKMKVEGIKEYELLLLVDDPYRKVRKELEELPNDD